MNLQYNLLTFQRIMPALMRIPICVDTIFRPQTKLVPMNNNRYRRERVVLSLQSDKNNIPVNNRIIGIIHCYKFCFCLNTFSLKNTTKNISSF